MPLYAYIKIPGIANSESTDSDYGTDWIPLTSIDLSNSADGGDDEFDRIRKDRKQQLKRAQNRKLALEAKAKGIDPSEVFSRLRGKSAPGTLGKNDTDTEPDYNLGQFFENVEKMADPIGDFLAEKAPNLSAGDAYGDDTMFGSRRSRDSKSGGTMTITKMLDSTSPELHKKCLQCLQYESNKYIEEPIEIHICRPLATPQGGTGSTVYMAYILEKSLITEIRFNASESTKLSETVTISFEVIHSCIRDNMRWDSKGWDFVNEKPAAKTNPTPP